jgi:hypothetical protein
METWRYVARAWMEGEMVSKGTVVNVFGDDVYVDATGPL